jgi:hypothetical protein
LYDFQSPGTLCSKNAASERRQTILKGIGSLARRVFASLSRRSSKKGNSRPNDGNFLLGVALRRGCLFLGDSWRVLGAVPFIAKNNYNIIYKYDARMNKTLKIVMNFVNKTRDVHCAVC